MVNKNIYILSIHTYIIALLFKVFIDTCSVYKVFKVWKYGIPLALCMRNTFNLLKLLTKNMNIYFLFFLYININFI